MARIPAGRFQRIADAFDEIAKVRLCESSGSEHSAAQSFTDLSDLVNSFMESDIDLHDKKDEEYDRDEKDEHKDEDFDGCSSDSETKRVLQNLFFQNDDDDENESMKLKICNEVEAAHGIMGESSSPGFKRRLMTYLREKGFDAGLCKSKWEKSKRYPAGDYEYIDVNVEGSRYIVEPLLAGQFEIARSTTQYTSLLEIFPKIFIGKVDKLKKIVRRICKAIKQSMKSNEMGIPPWRRNGYMQAKWFGSYKRTTINAVSSKNIGFESNDDNVKFSGNKSVYGFVALPTMPYFCRDINHHFANKKVNYGLKVGQLSATINTSGTYI